MPDVDAGAVASAPESITQPDPDAELEQFRRWHNFERSAESMDTRLTGFDLPEGAAETEPATVDDAPDEPDAVDPTPPDSSPVE